MLLLKNCRFIVTQNDKREVLEHQDILIQDNQIVKIGKADEKCPAIDCSDMLIMPGLINLHTHTCTNLLRGISDDLPLKDWLEKKVWPAERKIKDVYYGSLLTALESVKAGTTTFCDHSFGIERVAEAAETIGIRAFLSYCMLDLFDKNKIKEELKITKDLIPKLKNRELITQAIGIHAPNTCSEDLLKAGASLANELNMLNFIHILETKPEAEFIKKKTGKGVIDYLNSINFLNKNTIGIHLCWLNETKDYAKTGASAVHCPVSNLKLASGARLPVPELLKFKTNVSLGTDSNASNNNQDIFEEMKATGLLHKYSLNDSTVMPTQAILDMATRNAAEILRLKTGRIEKNFLADIIGIPINQPKFFPAKKETIISHIIYSSNGSDVELSIINGKVIMKNKQIKNEKTHLKSINDYFTKVKPF